MQREARKREQEKQKRQEEKQAAAEACKKKREEKEKEKECRQAEREARKRIREQQQTHVNKKRRTVNKQMVSSSESATTVTICPVCFGMYAENEASSVMWVECECCNKWLHLDCTTIPRRLYRRLDSLKFVCQLCQTRAPAKADTVDHNGMNYPITSTSHTLSLFKTV